MLLQISANRAIETNRIQEVTIVSPDHVVLDLGPVDIGYGNWATNYLDLYDFDARSFLVWYRAYSISWHRRPNGRPRPPRTQ